jgi:hypothetical protein
MLAQSATASVLGLTLALFTLSLGAQQACGVRRYFKVKAA